MAAAPANILLVDDQPANLDALEAILEGPDHVLFRAQTANEALLALLKHDFAAIVLDIRMPGVSGIELAELIKQRKRSQHIPIVFLTAHLSDDQDVLRGYGVGAVDYLSKPINPQILRSKLAVLVDLFRASRALEAANAALKEEVEQRQQAQAALQAANDDLEARVAARTAELEVAIAEAKSASLAKDHFLAVLSHELRTPLTPVLISAQLFERDPTVEDRVREAMSTIRRNIEMEARLIDDLLDLTRIAKGKLVLNVQDVDVNLVVRQAVQTCSMEAADKGVRLEVDLCSDHVHVEGDPSRLQQVFWNLVKNAIKFTPEGGQVAVTCARDEDDVVVRVRDTGVGIEPARLRHVFDAFEQGGAGVTKKFGGLGLGLAISRSLVEMCGGSIVARSEGPGTGAEFEVRLKSPEKPASNDGPVQGKGDAGCGAKQRGARVLLVEDHDDTAGLLEVVLESAGHSVVRAHNVASAVTAGRAADFDLLISDLGLPDGSGHDVARALLDGRRLPAIALSGYGMEDDLQASKAAGFREHLIKPINFEQLHAAIERVLAAGAT